MTTPVPRGERGLARLREQLDERDRAVLQDLAERRLMSGSQLQRLHVGEGPAAVRAAGRLLLRLLAAQLVTRLPRRVGGVRAGSSGYVYALTPTGRRILNFETGKVTRRTDLSDGFVDHTLALSELYTQLRLGHRSGQFELLSIDSEPRCWRRIDSLLDAAWLKPDLFVVTARNDDEWHSFVEWDNATEHRAALLRKLRAYEAAYRAGQEQRSRGLFPRAVWLVPTQQRANNLRRLIRSSGLTAELHAIGLQADALALLTGATRAD